MEPCRSGSRELPPEWRRGEFEVAENVGLVARVDVTWWDRGGTGSQLEVTLAAGTDVPFLKPPFPTGSKLGFPPAAGTEAPFLERPFPTEAEFPPLNLPLPLAARPSGPFERGIAL